MGLPVDNYLDVPCCYTPQGTHGKASSGYKVPRSITLKHKVFEN